MTTKVINNPGNGVCGVHSIAVATVIALMNPDRFSDMVSRPLIQNMITTEYRDDVSAMMDDVKAIYDDIISQGTLTRHQINTNHYKRFSFRLLKQFVPLAVQEHARINDDIRVNLSHNHQDDAPRYAEAYDYLSQQGNFDSLPRALWLNDPDMAIYKNVLFGPEVFELLEYNRWLDLRNPVTGHWTVHADSSLLTERFNENYQPYLLGSRSFFSTPNDVCAYELCVRESIEALKNQVLDYGKIHNLDQLKEIKKTLDQAKAAANQMISVGNLDESDLQTLTDAAQRLATYQQTLSERLADIPYREEQRGLLETILDKIFSFIQILVNLLKPALSPAFELSASA